MQYHLTQRVDRQQWEREPEAVVEEVRGQAQHDLSAQNPGSTVTIDGVEHTLRSRDVSAASGEDTAGYQIDFVVEYTVGGLPNMYDA